MKNKVNSCGQLLFHFSTQAKIIIEYQNRRKIFRILQIMKKS